MSDNEPVVWWPRAYWGTVREYIVVPNDNGGTDISFKFVPDDGGEVRSILLRDTDHIEGIGEHARGVFRGDDLSIKVSAASMAKVEHGLFARINQLDRANRKLMYADRTDIDGDCGWTWATGYKLVKVAPGLFDDWQGQAD